MNDLYALGQCVLLSCLGVSAVLIAVSAPINALKGRWFSQSPTSSE